MSNVSTLHEKQTTRNYCHFFDMEREKFLNACRQIMIFEVMKQHDFITHRRCCRCRRLIMQAALHKTWHILCKCEKFNKQKNKQFLEAYLGGHVKMLLSSFDTRSYDERRNVSLLTTFALHNVFTSVKVLNETLVC